MSRFLKVLFLFCVGGFIFSTALFAQTEERITITTYYPSPFGNYQELRAHHFAVGPNYTDRDVVCWNDGSCPGGSWLQDLPAGGNPGVSLVVEGRVGIGVPRGGSAPITQPAHLLDVAGTPADGYRMVRLSSDGTVGSGIEFNARAAGGRRYSLLATANAAGAGGARFGIFDESASAYRMVVTDIGRVGIGVTSPAQILQVNGDSEILSTGTGAGFKFRNREGGMDWVWYSSGNVGMLWNGVFGNVLWVQSNGYVSFRSGAAINGDLNSVSTIYASSGSFTDISVGDLTVSGAIHADNASLTLKSLHVLEDTHTNGDARVDGGLTVNNNSRFNGDLFIVGEMSAQTVVDRSDVRLKKNIVPLSHTLERLGKLRAVRYSWKDQTAGSESGERLGLVAQEVEEVFPEVVRTDAGGYKSIHTAGLNAVAIEAIKELKAENDALKARIEKLEAALGKPTL